MGRCRGPRGADVDLNGDIVVVTVRHSKPDLTGDGAGGAASGRRRRGRGQQPGVPARPRCRRGSDKAACRYGQWMRDEAEKRIGHLYPSVEVTSVLVRARPDLKPYENRTLTVIA